MKRLLVFFSLLLLILTIYPELQVTPNSTMAKYSVNWSIDNLQQTSKDKLNDNLENKNSDSINNSNSKNNTSKQNRSPVPPQSQINKPNKNNKITVSNPVHQLTLVNKEQALPTNFTPNDLVIPDIPFSFEKKLPKKHMRQEAARALEKLFTQAKRNNINIVGVSGYRSYARQQTIFAYNVKSKGEKLAKQVSAEPGHSEHQTGLAIDVSSPKVNYQLVKKFGQTREGKWLAQVAPRYGFIIRYPRGKENITGYQYEPWHIRYVGTRHAQRISRQDLTLEEYLDS